ncbi:transposase [Streptomyces sp. NPDC058812]|uniref:transposase n=1 Tax=unclassified Streptomyces TaxID=2593676 RepID=UPI0036921AEC
MDREPYPSDLSDEQWALLEPMITGWKRDRVARSATGDPGSCDLREVVNAIFYQNRTGCQWRYLPHDLPSWSAVFYYFTLWRQDGLFKNDVVIHGVLNDIDVEVVRRNPDDQGKGFIPQPKRWIVEQVNGTLLLHRRLARQYDHRPDTSVSRVYWASTANMARRLTTPSPAWRGDLGLAA